MNLLALDAATEMLGAALLLVLQRGFLGADIGILQYIVYTCIMYNA